MRTSLSLRIVMSTLVFAVLALLPALADEESPKAKIKKNPAAPAGTQTQTAPAGKEKKPPAPGEAGIRDVQGMVIRIVPEQHALIIRTVTLDYQVFLTPKSVVVRNGKPAAIKDILPGDRVDSCRFGTNKAVEKMALTSVGKAAGPAAP